MDNIPRFTVEYICMNLYDVVQMVYGFRLRCENDMWNEI